MPAGAQNDRESEALCEGDDFVWSDGSATDYTEWAAGEPNSWASGAANCDQDSKRLGPGEDCAEAWRGGESWADANCGGQNPFVCGLPCDASGGGGGGGGGH